MNIIIVYTLFCAVSLLFSGFTFIDSDNLDYVNKFYYDTSLYGVDLYKNTLASIDYNYISYRDIDMLLCHLCVDSNLGGNSYLVLEEISILIRICSIQNNFYYLYGEWLQSLLNLDEPVHLGATDLTLYSSFIEDLLI